MNVLLDTNVVLYLLRGDEQLVELLQGANAYVSVVTRIELFSQAKLGQENEKLIEAFLEQCTLVQLDPTVQDITIGIRKRHGLKVPDAMIAATAVYLNVQLITADKQFSRLKDEVSLLLIER